MRKRYVLLTLLTLVILTLAGAVTAGGAAARHAVAPRAAAKAGPSYVPGQVLVQFKAGVSKSGATAAAAGAQAAVVREIRSRGTQAGDRLYLMHSDTLSTPELIKQLSSDPSVRYVEPDYLLQADSTPNDPLLSAQWALAQIGAPAAWNVRSDASAVVIADIDTGANYLHPDLAANMWHNPGEIAGNHVDDDGNGYTDDVYGIDRVQMDTDPADDNGHGTATAGIIGAVGNNAVGVSGVCWQARIMALKFLDEDGSGATSDAVVCINYAIDQKLNHGVNVVAINASWGGGSYSLALHDAIAAAGTAGIAFITAAGNDGSDNDDSPDYPGSYDCTNIITVAATDSFDSLADFSNYGAASVDLGAPGVSLLTTVPSFVDPSGYVSFSGTSAAAPCVTGAVALCAAQFPSDTVSQRVSRVLASVDPVPALLGKCVTGGRLDLSRALGGTDPGDDDVPGLPLTVSPVPGTLDQSTDPNDCYRVSLKAGDVLTASISGAAGSNFDLFVFPPSATGVANHAAAVAQAVSTTYPDGLVFTATAAGTYYLDACATSGSGSYQITYSVGSDNDFPGFAIPASPVTGTVDASTDADDVFSLRLTRGQTIQVSLSGPASADFRVFLYPPGSVSVEDDYPTAAGTTGAYPRTLAYQVQDTGTYYLDVWAHTGSGAYSVTYAVLPAAADDDIPGIALVASPVTGEVAVGTDWADVYSFHAIAGQSVQMSVTGPAGTDFDLMLYAPGAVSLATSDPVASASGVSYPDGLTYVATTTGTYYLAVLAFDGSGAYTVTHSIDTTPPTTTASGFDALWHNLPVTVSFVGTDAGSGLAYTEYSVDGGAFVRGFLTVVSAGGAHTIAYRSADFAGNVEAAQTATVLVDPAGPGTVALGKVTVKKGKKATFRFRVDDLTPQSTDLIKIYKGKLLKKTIRLGLRPTNAASSYVWKCTLAKGSYTWKVYATDLAGNVQRVTGQKALVVK